MQEYVCIWLACLADDVNSIVPLRKSQVSGVLTVENVPFKGIWKTAYQTLVIWCLWQPSCAWNASNKVRPNFLEMAQSGKVLPMQAWILKFMFLLSQRCRVGDKHEPHWPIRWALGSMRDPVSKSENLGVVAYTFVLALWRLETGRCLSLRPACSA